jgi:acyl-CoA synthetase (NDP forming)/GNAT superfamily N-acetyltransferase
MSPSCQPPPDEAPVQPVQPLQGVYALLIDGTTVLIRPARPDDEASVRQMHEQMSPDNIYLRFFNVSRLSAVREGRRVTRPAGEGHCALLAWLGDRLVGLASYEPAGEPGVAEIAFAVTDDMHGRGVATLLLDHLISDARLRGLRAFKAQTLASNAAMLRVFASAGLAVSRQASQGVVDLTFPLPADEAREALAKYLDSVSRREQQADVASLRYLLRPRSVAVIGASRNPAGVGHAILRNIVTAGFGGRVFVINPRAAAIEGVPCLPSVADVPEPPDVAVIAVPAAGVVEVAQQCGRARAKALVIVTAGIDVATGAELLATCRQYGMRLVGPNCFGVAVPEIGLNATFAGTNPPPGTAGLIVQSGGIGIAVLEHLARLGIGVSSFASVGDKFDVSSNDLLMWWEQDGVTRLGVLYVESFGSPRKFAQTARRVGRKFPVLTVIGGRSPAGQRAAASHTATPPDATAATPLITQEALFGQAGVIATKSLGELIDTAALLAAQPFPRGNRIGIVSNAGGAGVLAADACGDNDLRVATLSRPVTDQLGQLLPRGAVVTGPVDATAAVGRSAFRSCLELIAGDDEVDAVMAITVRTALGDLAPAVTAANLAKPLVAVMLDQKESVRLLNGTDRQVPAYLYPESAARALGHAVRYGTWHASSPGIIPELDRIDAGRARTITDRFLAGQRLGGWLPAGEVSELLDCYGVRLSPPAAGEGTEVMIGVRHEPVFGPVVVFGASGALFDVLEDKTARLTPLTETDAAEMILGIQAAPLLLGQRGGVPADLDAIADLLLRVSRLADDLAEIAELELSPVIASAAAACPVQARIRLVPAEPADPFLRRLR